MAIRLLFLVAGIPQANLVDPKQYVAGLEALGYEDVRLDDISDHGEFCVPRSLRGLRQLAQGLIAERPLAAPPRPRAVFPGYSAFMARRDAELGDILHAGHWGGLMGYTKVVSWYADLAGSGKRARLAFVMVTARKPAA